jgi:hypothetical protein
MTTNEISINPCFAWPRWVQARWPEVRILGIDTPAPTRHVPKGMQTIRVHVRLGALTPADVRVEMAMGDAAMARDPSAAVIRLASTRCYGNGSFAFEAEVPRATLEGPKGFSIRVAPDPYHGVVLLPPVVQYVRARRGGSSVGHAIEYAQPHYIPAAS